MNSLFEARIRTLNEDNSSLSGGHEKRTYSIFEVQDMLGISRTTAYALVKQNLFHSVRAGRSIRISKKSFDEWLDSTSAVE